ncbi:potassium-transporting ATPase subunit KdpC [Mongoliitalea daihaiensis]|uniref:potassium-transporting ATPase subunit KdpC n=1 Tax=Mongoliitalea daihaiensis TaxID=2782006 RepID=UPI001F193A11|nr:potassium-transporting ATPase subunit KdpC [Mongoliitalea daihaiensis]UJP63950.1 potassium-transporting ATPase subunit KdpC [Mongoliitalea daihaiensis]
MIRQSISIILITLVLFGLIYPISIWGIGKIMPHSANGKPIILDGELRGFEHIAQNFSSQQYFWSRPSDVDYDASDTGGSNYGPTNEIFLSQVEERINYLLENHPEKSKADIPIDLVTASGSGLDPYISLDAAIFQANRVANARNLELSQVIELISDHNEGALFGLFGPKDIVHVLKLNLALDKLTKKD